ncbi:hypothetical protein ACYOEI_01070 [Singulisphaera rosea]
MAINDLIGRSPAEVFHPSVFIKDELEARGWTLDMLAMRMGPEFGINRLSLDLYIEVGPTEPGMRIGDLSAEALGRAFDVSPEFFLNLEAAWLKGTKA